MDPLSITASAVALIQAAGFTAQTIYTFVQSIRSADTRVTSICDELSGLQKYLEAVKNTLEKCSSDELAPVHNELWKRCNEALNDCLITLASLETWVSKIKDAMPSKGRRLGWRTRAVVDLRLHGEELVAFREKLQKSSIALQTMLHMITLSMSLKSNASQDKILYELDLLKNAFKKALRLSSQASNADARVSWNLHKLAAAARHFHSAASSTSGTNMDGSNDSWSARSLIGEFPEHKQQQIKQYLDDPQLHSPLPISGVSAQQNPPVTVTPQASSSTAPSPKSVNRATKNASPATVLESPQMGSESDDEDDEAEDEQEYFNVLHAWARDCIKNGKYTKAIDLLTSGMTRDFGTHSPLNEFREMQIELALCHFFQGDWKTAKPIVTDLSNSLDIVTCNLLHTLALFQLSEYSFDDALENCRKALVGKKKLLKSTYAQYDGYTPLLDYAESVALRATIHHMRGGPRDPIYAGNYYKKLPRGFEYKHPADPASFLSSHPCILSISLGQNSTAPPENMLVAPGGVPGFPTAGSVESPTAQHSHWISEIYRTGRIPISPLETRFDFLERYEQDTEKIVGDCPSPNSPAELGVGSDTGDESSPAQTPPARIEPLILHKSARTSMPRRRLTRYFTTRRPQYGAADEKEVVPPKEAMPPWNWNKLAFKRLGLWRRRKWFTKHDRPIADSAGEYGGRIMSWVNGQPQWLVTNMSEAAAVCGDTTHSSCLSPSERPWCTLRGSMNADVSHMSDANGCDYGYAQSSIQVSLASNRPPRSDNYFCPEDVAMSVEIGTQTSGAAKTSALASPSHLS